MTYTLKKIDRLLLPERKVYIEWYNQNNLYCFKPFINNRAALREFCAKNEDKIIQSLEFKPHESYIRVTLDEIPMT